MSKQTKRKPRKRYLAALLLAAACSDGRGITGLDASHNGWNHNLDISTFIAPDSAARGDTVLLEFTLTNTGSRNEEYVIVAALRDIPFFENTVAVELDVLEFRGSPNLNPDCQRVAPNVGAKEHGFLAGRSSRVFRWHWEVASLACVSPGSQPNAGQYNFQVNASERQGNRFRAADSSELPFKFTEAL